MSLNFTVCFIALTIIIVSQRVLEIVITQKKTTRGIVFYKWTFKALAIIHILTGTFSILEYFIIRRQINYLVTCVGFLFFLVALIVRNFAIANLGEFHSIHIEIRDNHALIKNGLYSHSRHPYYIAVCFEVSSLALIPNSFYSLCFAIFFYLPLVFFRAYKEEKVMANKFGNEFSNFKKQVPAFVQIKT
jgi:protein-S-isoprenylcysteine O-methyltransferase Ste14